MNASGAEPPTQEKGPKESGCWNCAHMTQKCPCPATEGRTWDYCRVFKRWGKAKKECSRWEEIEEKYEI